MGTEIPRLVIAGLSGDSGKTVVSLALLSALRRKGLTVSTFKKGPDYIDAAWLTEVSKSQCRNLDTFLVPSDDVRDSFIKHAKRSDVALVEGNRGVFDGRDPVGSHSTAELARLIEAPVILVANATKSTRTIAALVKGCQVFDPDMIIAGVVLNRVAGKRHEAILRETIEHYCSIPVVGAIPKMPDDDSFIPGRHLGLVTPAESVDIDILQSRLVELAEKYLDVERILSIARAATTIAAGQTEVSETTEGLSPDSVRIGYFHDRVFTFYYPENLEALVLAGAHLVPVSSLDDASLPEIEALYIGGGFPETHARALGRNPELMHDVKRAAEAGLPIYAECGGLMYLCRSLAVGGQVYPMAGLFPVDLALQKKPVGHGYVEGSVDSDNPFFPVGTEIRGHEFHYSGPTATTSSPSGCVQLKSGVGFKGGRDGLVYRNVLAAYLHIHASGVTTWAASLVSAARGYRQHRVSKSEDTDTDTYTDTVDGNGVARDHTNYTRSHRRGFEKEVTAAALARMD